MREDVQLVIARCREDVSWVAETGIPAVVYDKSGEPGPFALPNIGRETHTYLYHIVTNYPDFPPYTVFMQGAPFEHMGQHMGKAAGPQALVALIDEYVRRNVKFKGLAWYSLKFDRLGRPHTLCDESTRGRWAGYGRDIPVGEIYARLFDGPVPEKFHCRAPAGLLFVARERILARPLALYQAALKLVEADPLDERNTGHAMERLWYLIFNGYAALNRNSYD